MHKGTALSAGPADTLSAGAVLSPSDAKIDSSLPLLVAEVDPAVRKLRLFSMIFVLLLFFLTIPAMNAIGWVPDYKINVLGKYLCYVLVALGIDLIWGYTGLLSLCQALFFAIGGYAMAMHLALPQGGGDVRPEYNNIPQFLYFANPGSTSLPTFWLPFQSLTATVILAVLLPGIVAAIFGFFIFRSRVRGVYFSILTQAVAWGLWLLISRNEMLLGGTNGLTNFSKSLTQDKHNIMLLYLLTAAMVVIGYVICRAITKSRLGRILVAVRDKETRLYFAGYKPYAFKVFAFAMAAMLAGAGGMLYPPQVGIITPQNMNTEESIFMVVGVALGGRGRLWGAAFGALLLNYSRSTLTSDLSSHWLLVQGLMVILVVLFFPLGFAGLWDRVEQLVASRAGAVSAMIAAAPLLILGLFVFAEATGLMPPVLSKVVLRYGDTPIHYKYLLIILLLVASSMATRFRAKHDLAAAIARRGFEPEITSSGAAKPEGAA